MIQCPSCGRRQEPRLTCEGCGAPLGAELDCFAVFGLPKKLVIDATALERAYHDLSRRIHPDRFAQQGPRARDASLRSTALLTRSYRTLREPVARGLYWLELRGDKLGENNKQVPPGLAELVFDVQEQLEDARAAASRGAAAAAAQSIAARRDELQRAMDEVTAELLGNFERSDRAGEIGTSALAAELKAILSKIAYLRTLIRDVDREIEKLKAA
jgi:molecular chaperone HscB